MVQPFLPLVSSGAGYRLQTKIQLLKASLKTWSNSILVNYSQIKSSQLNTIQDLDRKRESQPLLASKSNLRTQTKMEYFSTLKKEELYWFQRSKVNWLKVGDHNPGFIHRIPNCRKRDNSISIIRVGNRKLDQPAKIESVVLDFFQDHYSAPSGLRLRMANRDFLTLLDHWSQWLERPFSETEILEAINDLAKDKAPGPNGFPQAPFKTFGILSKQTLRVSSMNSSNVESSTKPSMPLSSLLSPRLKG
ncbi:hypothetical protein AMTRI_Chr13g88100 [Amborella trichopoda]